MTELVQTTLGDSVAVVRVDRPPANAINLTLLRELLAAIADLELDPPAAVVVTGREGCFSAGLDLKEVPALDPDGLSEMVLGIDRMVAGLYRLPCPVVASITGHAIAGGLVLALCADYRVCATQGKLGLTEVKAGIPFPAGAMGVVREELTPQAARVLSLRSDLCDPPQALALGVVDELAPPAAVLERSMAVARELSALPAETYARVKRQLRGEAMDEFSRIVAEQDDPMLDGWIGPS